MSDPATVFGDRLMAMERELERIELVVDIGAHVGALTLPCLARNATVIAVEPCMMHFMALLLQASEVGAGTLLPLAAAVWDQGGRLLPLYGRTVDGKHADPGQLSLVPYQQSAVVAWAATITLDEIFKNIEPPNIDLLKIDVEGAEHRILPGFPLEQLRRCRFIDLDNHDIRNEGFFTQQLVGWSDLPAVLTDAGFVLQPSGLWKRVA